MTSKFILTGFPRTGTTVVSGSLILNPEALFYGELFNEFHEVRHSEAQRVTLGAGWKFEKALDWGINVCPPNVSTHQYMDDFFSRDVPFKALGFKILYHQVIEGPNSDVWSYIANDPEIKIIRTQRENLIEIICSYVRASMTRRWHAPGQDTLKQHRFIIPPEEFLNLLKKFDSPPSAIAHIEQSHQILDLEYQRISDDFHGCMSDIFSFLDIDKSEVVPPRLKKIAQLTPDQELANYQDLKQHFQDTPYSRYFVF